MAIDLDSIKQRLDRTREELVILRRLSGLPRHVFTSDAEKIRVAERSLQVAIQCCLDIGNHIVAARDLGRPIDNEAIFRLLGDHGIVPMESIPKLVQMARFRNLLVHLYLRVRAEELYRIIQEDLEDIEAFMEHVVYFVERYGSEGM